MILAPAGAAGRPAAPGRALLLGALLLGAAMPLPAARLALVIGNDTYRHVATLANAHNDAELMAGTLKQAGFELVGGVRADLDRKSMWAAIDQLQHRITPGDEVVFYYAGHGVQIGADAMLLPVDIEADSDEEVLRDAVNLADVQDELKAARFALLVIDACRNNPFPPAPGRTRGIGESRGLLPVEPAEGSAIIMSASRGQTALDSVPGVTSSNGLFTYMLVQAISKPGVDVLSALRQARDDIEDQARRANHEQRPALVEEMRGEFVLFPATAAASPAASTVAAAPTPLPPIAPHPVSSLRTVAPQWKLSLQGHDSAEQYQCSVRAMLDRTLQAGFAVAGTVVQFDVRLIGSVYGLTPAKDGMSFLVPQHLTLQLDAGTHRRLLLESEHGCRSDQECEASYTPNGGFNLKPQEFDALMSAATGVVRIEAGAQTTAYRFALAPLQQLIRDNCNADFIRQALTHNQH